MSDTRTFRRDSSLLSPARPSLEMRTANDSRRSGSFEVARDFCAFESMLDVRGFAFVRLDPHLYARCVDDVAALRQRVREPGRFCRGALGEMRLSSTPSVWVELYLTRRRQKTEETRNSTAAFVHRLEPVCFQEPGESCSPDWRRAAVGSKSADLEKTAGEAGRKRDPELRVSVSLLGRHRIARIRRSENRRLLGEDAEGRCQERTQEGARVERRSKRSSRRRWKKDSRDRLSLSLDVAAGLPRALVYFDTRVVAATRNRSDADWCTLDYSFVSVEEDPFDFCTRLLCLRRGLCPWQSEHRRLLSLAQTRLDEPPDAEFVAILGCPAATSHPRPLTFERAAFLLRASQRAKADRGCDRGLFAPSPSLLRPPLRSRHFDLTSPSFLPSSLRRRRLLDRRPISRSRRSRRWQRRRTRNGRNAAAIDALDPAVVARLEWMAAENEGARFLTGSVGAVIPKSRSPRLGRASGSRACMPILNLEHERIWNDLVTSLEDLEDASDAGGEKEGEQIEEKDEGDKEDEGDEDERRRNRLDRLRGRGRRIRRPFAYGDAAGARARALLVSAIARVVYDRGPLSKKSQENATRFFPRRTIRTGDWLARHHRLVARIGKRVWRMAAKREVDATDVRDCGEQFSAESFPFSAGGECRSADRSAASRVVGGPGRVGGERRGGEEGRCTDVDSTGSDVSPAYATVRSLRDFVVYYSSLVDYLASTRTVVGDAVFVRIRRAAPEVFADFLVDVVFRRGDALATLFRETVDEREGRRALGGPASTCLWCSQWHRLTDDDPVRRVGPNSAI